MPENALPPLWLILGNTLVIVMSIAVLIFLFVIIPTDCAGISEATGGKTSCGLEPGAYLFGAVFVVLLVYAGFNLFRMLFPVKKDSCRFCSLLSKK